jgi:glyoxylate/hydroxypyruvate reductase A
MLRAGLTLFTDADAVDVPEILYVLACAPSDDLLQFTNLEVLFCVGASVDQLHFDTLPSHLKVDRIFVTNR